MSCPHCHAQVPEERPTGGQCPACRRLFVRSGRVAYGELTPEFLPYPSPVRRPWWHVRPTGETPVPAYVFAATVIVAAAIVAAAVHWNWSAGTIVLAAVVSYPVVVGGLAYVLYVLVEVAAIAVRGPARLVRRLAERRRRVVLTPEAFTALARTVAPDVVDEHGMAPPPAPEPARFAGLCPDPAVAACLWANDVGGRLGALVVVARRELRHGMPVLDLSRSTAADPPLTLMTQVLRFGREHADAGRTGFLSWPVSG